MWRERLNNWRASLRARLRLLIATATVLLCVIFHAPLLQLLAGGLIASDPVSRTDYVLVYDGDGKYDVAQKLHAQGLVRRIALVRGPADRLVQHQIVAARHEVALRELIRRNIPADAIVVLPEEAENAWEAADAIAELLKTGEARSVAILADRFESRTLRHIVNSVLDDEQQSRTKIYPLEDRRYSEADWWQSKVGIRSFVISTMGYAYTLLHGRDRAASLPWDVDDVERHLR